ncbi:MAG TPA: VWA domain-containing protein [Dehalococcoidia bacterium]|nr:VWA domain-containing protein [Dehalococcoidia bacterium]
MMRFRYSEWDGSQDVPSLDADELLEAVTDDLMNFGDLQQALRNLLQRGYRNPAGQRMQGMRDLMQQLRQNRRQILDRYNLSSVFDDIKKRLDEILDLEQTTLKNRLDEADRQLSGGENPLQAFEEAMQQGSQGQEQQRGNAGQQGSADEQRQLAQMLKNIAEKKQNFLDNLPEDPGGRVKELQNYEFVDPEAAAKFQELMEGLKKAMMDTFFQDLYDQISKMGPEETQRLKEMLRDLNQMLSEKMAGGQPDFQSFMDKYGDMFGPNPPQSLEELMAQMQQQMASMQSLLDSLPSDMRRQLQDLLMEKIGDADLQRELQELAINMEILAPLPENQSPYPFRGEEELDLLQAMHLMDQLQDMDSLEKQLEQTQYGGSLDDIDVEKLREILGDEAFETIQQLKEFLKMLEDAGYIRRKEGSWELTPRGIRKIGQKALGEIYAQLKKSAYGKHPTPERGPGGERADDTKKYEFGDPFHLHLGRTTMNAMLRDGPNVPIRLKEGDFEVYASEQITTTATVMMLDLSWSMALRGSFQAAKKVALALNNLIRTQFPRDALYILGFSAYARELKAEELPYVRWDESVLGTNMHHALMLAQNLLAKHNNGTRQIIMISDGEPTAHLEHGRSFFSYPPSPITIRETLKEVRRCTRKGVTINTFMLDRNYYLKEFVNQIAKINKGRVFYTTPDRLGQYILVDYVNQKRKQVNAA